MGAFDYTPEQLQKTGNMGPGVGMALSAGSGIIGSLISNRGNRKMAEWQNTKQMENWATANEWNSPANQMARLSEAGLNPHLMYGQGTTGNAPAPTGVTKPDMQMKIPDPQAIQKIAQHQNIKQSKAQVNLMEENENLIEQKAINEATRTAIYSGQAELMGIKVDIADKTKPYVLIQSQATADKAVADAKTAELGREQRVMEIAMKSEAVRKLKADATMAEFEAIMFTESGITRADKVHFRAAYAQWSKMTPEQKEVSSRPKIDMSIYQRNKD